MKKIYSLVIGRFQCVPPHKGHLTLINTLLKEGKNICIALRDTEQDEKNPYSYDERFKAFQRIYKEEIGNQTVKIIKIPDIEEVVCGRRVGWEFRKIDLPKEIENISGTKMREQGRG